MPTPLSCRKTTCWHITSDCCRETLWSPSVKHPKNLEPDNRQFLLFHVGGWAGRPPPAAATACSGQCPAGPPAKWGTCQRWRFKTPKANICGGNRLTFQTFPCPGPARGPRICQGPHNRASARLNDSNKRKEKKEKKLNCLWCEVNVNGVCVTCVETKEH